MSKCPHAGVHDHRDTRSLTHSLIHSLTHSLTHSFTHSLTHSLTHALTHSLNVSIAPFSVSFGCLYVWHNTMHLVGSQLFAAHLLCSPGFLEVVGLRPTWSGGNNDWWVQLFFTEEQEHEKEEQEKEEGRQRSL